MRRRDGAALLLTREDRATASAGGAVDAARALRNILGHISTDAAAKALVDEFPWVECLPADACAEFVTDFTRACQASAEIGRWALLTQTLIEWKSTAAIYADSVLSEKLAEPLSGDDFGAVPDPLDV